MATSVMEPETAAGAADGTPAGTHARAVREGREPCAPVTGTIRSACTLGAPAELVPFIALTELPDTLLAPGPLDTGRIELITWLVVTGLSAQGLLMGVALTMPHCANLRPRMVRRLGHGCPWADSPRPPRARSTRRPRTM